ncbi:MAG: asparagine synthase (glutamine-hydrolyzing) [Candidatus Eisenbacteria bacterium]|nr:asparagine synthase (glutamine-hydrolyzing) [Candidatus Eisenbacteria bacterium]MCC7142069.1 asparagine synthase (glutamine-hydrolyzing) [Candidatus Eisenbacteria bacterium]
MCGIAGILNLTEREAPGIDALTRMVGALRHRGPDEFGLYRDERCGLGHARLSIIDVATGQQPLSDATGEHWLAFNGEIFNYVELRAELQALGHRFRTQSDTEVIVEAYRAWGLAAFARMNGQFALGLWDGRRLVLARDAVGIVPLYLSEHGGRLYFASEVKAIFAADPNLPRRIDPLALEETFSFWTVVPPRAVFTGVEELRPGYLRVYEAGRWREQPHFQARYPLGEEGAFRGTPEDAAEAVRHALEEATRLRMLRADVPVGSYLSGGLDSSLVAALGLRAMGSRFQTFSLRFQDAEYDETGFQREMVSRLESDHHEVVVSRADIARVFPQVIAHTERPILRTAPAPLFLLSALVRAHGIKVVLTGEGADEMFAGYDLFREAKVRRFWARAPQSLWRPRLLERLYPYLQRSPVSQQAMARQFFGRNLSGWRDPGFAHDTRWQGTAALKRLFAPAVREAVRGSDVVGELLASLPPEFPRWSFLAQDQYLEVRTLLSGYLLSSQGDRMLMAHSVEGRFPFLDSEVIALANSLPAEYKLRGLDEKRVLKQAARDLVPQSILERKKQPYRAPDALSFVGPDTPEYVAAALRPEEVARIGLFDPEVVERLWRKCRERSEDGQFSNADNMAVVGVLSTQLLHQQLVDGVDRSLPSIEWRTFVDRLGPQS